MEPERHPNDPADPCDSFADGHADADSDERARSYEYERIVWMASLLINVLTQHDQAHDRTACGAHDQTVTRAAFSNRHPTEDEQGISAKFPEVKGDGAMAATVPVSKWAHLHQMIKPPNADDADRLCISLASLTALTDFLRRSTIQFALASDARYDNPSPELDCEVRSRPSNGEATGWVQGPVGEKEASRCSNSDYTHYTRDRPAIGPTTPTRAASTHH